MCIRDSDRPWSSPWPGTRGTREVRRTLVCDAWYRPCPGPVACWNTGPPPICGGGCTPCPPPLSTSAVPARWLSGSADARRGRPVHTSAHSAHQCTPVHTAKQPKTTLEQQQSRQGWIVCLRLGPAFGCGVGALARKLGGEAGKKNLEKKSSESVGAQRTDLGLDKGGDGVGACRVLVADAHVTCLVPAVAR
eukprot:3936076-Rhodomonas_salina.1